MKKYIRPSIVAAGLICLGILVFGIFRSPGRAAGGLALEAAPAAVASIHASPQATQMGLSPTSLTLRTGQTFYLAVIVNSVEDLYAWQCGASFSETYLEYLYTTPAQFLTLDGAGRYFAPPLVESGRFKWAATTRILVQAGITGSGEIAYFFFRARKATSSTSVTLYDCELVDRNARTIERDLLNSGKSTVTVSDSAPVSEQPPAGWMAFLPYAIP